MPDDGSVTGKVAIITGGASGMGLATAKRFLAELADRASEAAARARSLPGPG